MHCKILISSKYSIMRIFSILIKNFRNKNYPDTNTTAETVLFRLYLKNFLRLSHSLPQKRSFSLPLSFLSHYDLRSPFISLRRTTISNNIKYYKKKTTPPQRRNFSISDRATVAVIKSPLLNHKNYATH